MKNTKLSETQQDINVINAYNGPQNLFEGIPTQYRSFFDFDVALIKERHKGTNNSAPDVILQKAYFEMQ